MAPQPGYTWPDHRLAPCGTPAAARRHWRRGEPLDEACRQADRNRGARCRGYAFGNTQVPDRREKRNGLPEFRPYTYQGTGRDLFDGTDLFEEAS
jgi:hypothetical protein